MLIHNLRAILKCCFVLVILGTSLCGIEAVSLAIPVESHRLAVVPFTGLQVDSDYRPHQLVTAGVRANISSPLICGTFLFDTGASGSFVSASFAQKLDTPQYQAASVSINHISAPEVQKATKAAALEIGVLNIQHPVFHILPDQELTLGNDQKIDGILGADLWSSFAVQVNFTRSQIVFTIPVAETLSYDTLNQNPVLLSPAGIAAQGFGSAFSIPMIEYGGSFLTDASVRNGSSAATDLMVIDSGSDITFLSHQVTQKLNLQTISQQRTISFPGIQETTDLAWLPSFISGSLKLNDLLVRSNAENQVGSILGLDILSNYDVLFDFPHKRMYLKPRTDLQVVTSHQYKAASSTQRQQWTRSKLIITYPTSTIDVGLAISYVPTVQGLPITQGWPNEVVVQTPFLLSSNVKNTFICDELAKQWNVTPQVLLGDSGKPRLLFGKAVRVVTLSKLHISGTSGKIKLGVLPAEGLLRYTNNPSLQGVVGASFLFMHPLLMDATTQTWFILTHLDPEDLPSLEMSDAVVVDILDPDGDGIPAVAVQQQQGAAHCTDTMTLATGSPFTLLSAQAAKTLALTPEPQKLKYGVGKDSILFNQAHLSQLSIGGVALQNVPVAYPITAMPDGFYPRLGMNVISKLRLLVDAPNKKMYVKKAGK